MTSLPATMISMLLCSSCLRNKRLPRRKPILRFAGIGAAVAKGFARSGCTKIAITDINFDTLKQTKDAIQSISPSVQVFDQVGDIADESFVDSFTDEVTSKFSRLDYAVNCAGVLGGKPVKQVDMTMETFDKLNNINYRGSWLSSRAQLRNMLKQEPLSEQPGQRGSIVNIASQLGIVARPGAGEATNDHVKLLEFTLTMLQRLIAHQSPRSST